VIAEDIAEPKVGFGNIVDVLFLRFQMSARRADIAYG